MCFTVIFLFVSVSLLNKTNIDENKNSVTLNYDVFISFHGLDTRDGFLSHLVEAFSKKKIVVFVDDKLHKGDEISSALFQAIETSLISLVIFSENYASSRWCLDELVKIVQWKNKYGQILLPVFYKVQPTTVRHQKGTYANAFAEHEKNESLTMVEVEQWRSALTESGNINGYVSTNFP
jgi:hypothetical protein